MMLSEEAKKLDQELDEAIKEAAGPNLNKELNNIMNGGKVSHVAKTYADYEREANDG